MSYADNVQNSLCFDLVAKERIIILFPGQQKIIFNYIIIFVFLY